jgi:DNA-binding PadR family transcriptional regulator
MIGEALKGHLDLLLLAILSGGPMHGYAIIESLRSKSEGTFDLPEGTIYPALHRLENQGLLRSHWSDGPVRRKRIYQISPRGEQIFIQRRMEWKKFSKAVDSLVTI